jgi:LPXTG-motif cell wall-anchored protein
MKRLALVSGIAMVAVVAAAGVALAADVTIQNFQFQPASVTVTEGDSVTWTNQDAAPHTATADDGSFDTGTLNQGDSGSLTFDNVGSFAYHCSFHPSMTGTVVVQAASGGDGGGDGNGGDGGGLPQTATRWPLVAGAGLIVLGIGLWIGRRRKVVGSEE